MRHHASPSKTLKVLNVPVSKSTCLIPCRSSTAPKRWNISAAGKNVCIVGRSKLVGKKVVATDLRGGASMVICGLIADGVTIITNVNSNLDYDFYTNVRDTDITKGNLLIVNKQ